MFRELDRILGLRGDEWKDLFVVRPDLKDYSIAFLRSLTEPQSVSIRRVGNLVLKLLYRAIFCRVGQKNR